MKEKKNKKSKISLLLLIVGGFLVVFLLIFIITSKIYLSAVDEDNESYVEFAVPQGYGKNQIADELEKAGLIKSSLYFKFYIKFNINKELYAGTYKISKSMTVDEIIDLLNSNNSIENETITITFVEGKRFKNYAEKISEYYNYSSDEIIDVASDVEFLNGLINNYWFVTDEILNDNILYPLEGYIFPDTYSFRKNASIEEILEKMVKTLGDRLDDYKDELNLEKDNIHDIITLASIVEQEGANSDDRAGVAGVFYNRLNDGWTLGSDATTYYSVQKDYSSDLTYSELNKCDAYNTRGNCVSGLPVGPICSPSISSISAAINPKVHHYYYFVADKNKKTYFTETSSEHNAIINKLKKENLWFEY